MIREKCAGEGVSVYTPSPKYCTDNGAMVAVTAYFYAQRGPFFAFGYEGLFENEMDLDRPLKKSLGQHLLKDKNLLGKMVRSSGISASDTVIEIGPGHGDFTRAIAPQARYGVLL